MSAHGNMFEAAGRVSPVSISLIHFGGSLAFSDNVCRLVGSASQGPVGNLVTRNGGLSVTGNHFYGTPAVSLIVSPSPAVGGGGKFTAVGNVATGKMQVGAIPFQAPWDKLNVTI